MKRGPLWRLGRVESAEEAITRMETGERVDEDPEPVTARLQVELKVYGIKPLAPIDPRRFVITSVYDAPILAQFGAIVDEGARLVEQLQAEARLLAAA